MTLARILSALTVACALAASANAQMAGESPITACAYVEPRTPEYRRYAAEQWPKEAERYKRDGQPVSRNDDRLRLGLEGGKSIELLDCPGGDTGYAYLYDRYDPAGGFYALRTPAYEDFYYTLVMKKTGKLLTVDNEPNWAPDRSRFLTLACNLLAARTRIAIYAPAGDSLRQEGEVELPCRPDTLPCEARWGTPSSIAVLCSGTSSGKVVRAELALRQVDGVWQKAER